MKSKIIKNTTLYTIGNVLPKAAGFILLPIYTRYLSPEEYGIVQSMQVLITILAIVFSLALERCITRLYWDYKTEEEKKEFLGTITISLTLIAILMLSLTLTLKGLVGRIYSSIDFYPFYLYAIFITFVLVLSFVPRIYLMVTQQASKFITISIVQFVLTSTLTLFFIIVKGDGAIGMLKGRLISLILIVPIYISISMGIINFRFNFRILKKCLSYSLPIMPTLMMAWILNLSDRIFIERYFTLSDVGIYSLGCKIAGLVLIIMLGIEKAYSPVFYKLANSEDQEFARKKIGQYNNTIILVTLFSCFIITFFAKEVIILIFPDKYIQAYKVIPIISFGYFIIQLDGFAGSFIKQAKKTIVIMYIVIAGAALNILLNFLLVPTFGALGAAWATFVSFLFIFVIKYSFSKRYYFIPFNWKMINPIILLAVFLVIGFNFISAFNVTITLILKMFTVLIFGSIFIFKYYGKIRMIITQQ